MKAEGRINPELDIRSLSHVFQIIGDGLFWRRATDPDFDPARTIPAVMHTIQSLLGANLSDTVRQRLPVRAPAEAKP